MLEGNFPCGLLSKDRSLEVKFRIIRHAHLDEVNQDGLHAEEPLGLGHGAHGVGSIITIWKLADIFQLLEFKVDQLLTPYVSASHKNASLISSRDSGTNARGKSERFYLSFEIWSALDVMFCLAALKFVLPIFPQNLGLLIFSI